MQYDPQPVLRLIESLLKRAIEDKDWEQVESIANQIIKMTGD